METSTLASSFTGLEIQEESAQMAARSVELNKLSTKVQIVQGDIKAVSSIFPNVTKPATWLKNKTFW